MSLRCTEVIQNIFSEIVQRLCQEFQFFWYLLDQVLSYFLFSYLPNMEVFFLWPFRFQTKHGFSLISRALVMCIGFPWDEMRREALCVLSKFINTNFNMEFDMGNFSRLDSNFLEPISRLMAHTYIFNQSPV